MKKDLLKLKGNPAIICYIEMLQSNIARMSSHSGVVKASICAIFTVVTTILLAVNIASDYWWIMMFITIMGILLDSFYLAMEKTYVEKYDIFIANLNKGCVNLEEIYDLKPKTTKLKCELLARIISSFLSFSVVGFYGILIMICLFILFI